MNAIPPAGVGVLGESLLVPLLCDVNLTPRAVVHRGLGPAHVVALAETSGAQFADLFRDAAETARAADEN